MTLTLTLTLDARSERNLRGVHPALVRVVLRAHQNSPVDFIVTEGVRTAARQRKLVEEGKSRTMNSRHLTGHAIDVAAKPNGGVSWEPQHYAPIAKAMKAAARAEGVKIRWGGDFQGGWDKPHFELDWSAYPLGASGVALAKPLYKSKIAAGSAGVGILGGDQALDSVSDAAAQVAAIKGSADDIGLLEILERCASSPRFWIALGVIAIAAAIVYWRWKDHG